MGFSNHIIVLYVIVLNYHISMALSCLCYFSGDRMLMLVFLCFVYWEKNERWRGWIIALDDPVVLISIQHTPVSNHRFRFQRINDTVSACVCATGCTLVIPWDNAEPRDLSRENLARFPSKHCEQQPANQWRLLFSHTNRDLHSLRLLFPYLLHGLVWPVASFRLPLSVVFSP